MSDHTTPMRYCRLLIPKVGKFAKVGIADSTNLWRNAAMLMRTFYHGLRVSELCDLRRQDVDLHHGRIWIARLTGSHSLPVSPDSSSRARKHREGSLLVPMAVCHPYGQHTLCKKTHNRTRGLAVKHATGCRRAVADPHEWPAGAAAPLSLCRTTLCARLEPWGRPGRPA
jgi:integrase